MDVGSASLIVYLLADTILGAVKVTVQVLLLKVHAFEAITVDYKGLATFDISLS